MRVLRAALIGCIAAAFIAAIAGPVAGHAFLGLGIAAGLLIGAGNGYAAERMVKVGVPFIATSMARLVVLTLVALGAALVLGFDRAWMVVLGVAAAQLILALSAAAEVIRR